MEEPVAPSPISCSLVRHDEKEREKSLRDLYRYTEAPDKARDKTSVWKKENRGRALNYENESQSV